MEKSTEIILSELPKEVLSKIPYSIRTRKSSYLLGELPLEIQYIVQKYYDTKFPTISYEDALDFKAEISKYSDFGVYTETYKLLQDYLRNYLLTRLKSYPYDPEFGCALKDQLMMLDTTLRQTYVANELKMVAGVLSEDLDLQIEIVKFNINRFSGTASTQYSCDIELKVNGDLSKVVVTTSSD